MEDIFDDVVFDVEDYLHEELRDEEREVLRKTRKYKKKK